MTDSTSGWVAPASRSVPATHWPPKTPAGTSTWRNQRHGAPYAPPTAVPPSYAASRPASPQPRPTFREVHQVTPIGVFAAAGVAVLWFLVTALLGVDLPSTMWVVLVASVFATGGAVLLARYGDRGAAVGVGAVAGVALAVVGTVVEYHAFVNQTWILW